MRAGRSASPRCRPRRATSPRACSPRCAWRWTAIGSSGGDVGLLSHATTVVTNAILEGHGARAALVTTRGFRDVLELRRSARADLYDLFQDAPATLVPRRRRFEITERIGADGRIVTPLAESEIDGADRHAEGAARRGDRRLAAVQLPQPGARAAARRAPARGAARPAHLPVLRGAAGDQGVRAHQHHRGVRLRRPDPRLLSGAPGGRHAQPGPAAALRDGLERRHPRGRRGRGHAGDGGGVGPGGRRGGGGAGGAADRAGRSAVLRHGRHHRQGQPDPRRPVRDDAGVRGRRRRLEPAAAGCTAPAIRSACRSSTWPRCRPAAARSPGWTGPAPCASARRAPAPIPAPSATRAAAPSRPSPTATCCSAISTRARCSPATCPSTMRRPKRPSPSASPSRWASTRARRPRPSSTSSITPWPRRSRSSRCSAATIRASSCWRPSAGRGRCMPPRWPPSSASPRSSARRSPAPSRRSASIGTDLKRDYVRTVYTTTASADPAALEAVFAALETEGAAMLDRAGVAPERRRFERSVDARYERQSYELSIPVPARALDAGGAGGDRRGLPRPPPRDLRPRQPQRAGAARQRAPGRHRRHSAAADPRQDGAGGDRCGQEQPRGVVPADGGDRCRRLRSPAHARRAGGAGPGDHRIAGVDHSRPAGLAGDDERRRLRGAHAFPLSPLAGRGSG